MISFEKKFLFVHIPRAAGNSIQTVLGKYADDEIVSLRGEQDGIERFGLRNPKYNLKKHSTLAEYHRALGDQKFRELYKFTCVRNPWERMISYYFRPTRPTQQWDRQSFKEMVQRAVSVSDYLRLTESDADPFGNVDYVMRFENIEADFRHVCAAVNVPAAQLPRYNRAARDAYATYYDDELREFVRPEFAAEIERFGYTFEIGRAHV